jgi:hypothetical protein
MQMQIGDKMVEVDMSSGVPVIHATAEEIKRPDGGQDVIVKVPCLNITAKKE